MVDNGRNLPNFGRARSKHNEFWSSTLETKHGRHIPNFGRARSKNFVFWVELGQARSKHILLVSSTVERRARLSTVETFQILVEQVRKYVFWGRAWSSTVETYRILVEQGQNKPNFVFARSKHTEFCFRRVKTYRMFGQQGRNTIFLIDKNEK